MLVLIASETSPSAAHRRHTAVDGELVTPVVIECGNPHCDSCQRGWFGLVSHAATATAMVVERPGVTTADLRARLHSWLDCGGRIDAVVQSVEAGEFTLDGVPVDDPVAAVSAIVDEHVREIQSICATYPVGTVVGRLGSLVAPHHLGHAA